MPSFPETPEANRVDIMQQGTQGNLGFLCSTGFPTEGMDQRLAPYLSQQEYTSVIEKCIATLAQLKSRARSAIFVLTGIAVGCAVGAQLVGEESMLYVIFGLAGCVVCCLNVPMLFKCRSKVKIQMTANMAPWISKGLRCEYFGGSGGKRTGPSSPARIIVYLPSDAAGAQPVIMGQGA